MIDLSFRRINTPSKKKTSSPCDASYVRKPTLCCCCGETLWAKRWEGDFVCGKKNTGGLRRYCPRAGKRIAINSFSAKDRTLLRLHPAFWNEGFRINGSGGKFQPKFPDFARKPQPRLS